MTTWLEPVKLASTKTDGSIPVNVLWSGMIDGRTVALGDRVLLRHEHEQSKNGVYLYLDKGEGPQLVGPEEAAVGAAVLALDGETLALTEHVQHEPGVWNHRKVFVVRPVLREKPDDTAAIQVAVRAAQGDENSGKVFVVSAPAETDDTAAVREAFTAAFASGMSKPTIYFPPMRAGYRLAGPIEVLRPCTILGGGMAAASSEPDGCVLGDNARIRLVNNGEADGVYCRIEGNVFER